jgi:hypothetical protein
MTKTAKIETPSAALFNAYKATLSAEAAHGKARDAYRHAARVLWEAAGEAVQDAIRENPTEIKDYAREAVLVAFKAHKASIKNATAWKNTTQAVRDLMLLVAFPDIPVTLPPVGDADTGETITAQAAGGNAKTEQLAVRAVRETIGIANKRAPKTPTADKPSDPIKAGQKRFEDDMVAARAAFESILAMQSGWGMVIDVLKLRGFDVVKIIKNP